MAFYAIVMKNHPTSEQYFELLKQDFYKINPDDELTVVPAMWEGNKEYRDSTRLNFGKKKSLDPNSIREFTPSERYVFYSHIYAWNEIIKSKTPGWIFEHDADLSELPYLPPKVTSVEFLSLGGSILHSYYLTPWCAKRLKNSLKSKNNIYINVDGCVHTEFDIMLKNNINVFHGFFIDEFKCRTHLGVTIDHKNKGANLKI
jgi:hypothetical protein